MADNFNYQDVFKTNIPQLEQNVNLHASYLLDAAHDWDLYDPAILEHLRLPNDPNNTYQAFWELKEQTGRIIKEVDGLEIRETRTIRLLAITAGGRIGLDRRPTRLQPVYRKSFDGEMVFDSDPTSPTFNGSKSEEEEVRLFYDTFYETVAALGIHHQLLRIFGTRNESSEEGFATAA